METENIMFAGVSYKQVKRICNSYVLLMLLDPIILFGALFLFPERFETFFLLFCIFNGILGIPFGWFIAAHDWCPWCNGKFFTYSGGRFETKSLKAIVFVRCANCGMPKKQNSPASE
jgi:hypothetical protein